MQVADETISRADRYNCNSCCFFEPVSGETPGGSILPVGGGICRRKAPVSVMHISREVETFSIPQPGVWPMTNGNDWCGEHPMRVASYSHAVAKACSTLTRLDWDRKP